MKTNTFTKSAGEYLKEPYARILIPEEGGRYSAEVLEFPGCFSQGDTAEEAIYNLEEAAKNWIETTLESGKPIPNPSAHYGYNGKIALRLPGSLHQKAVQLAERDGVSLNTFLVGAIAARVAAKELSDGLLDKMKQMLQEMENRVHKHTTQHGLKLAASVVKLMDGSITAQRMPGMVTRGSQPLGWPIMDSLSNVEHKKASFSELDSLLQQL